jgi:secretion/DNA translocation related TadE-like protein
VPRRCRVWRSDDGSGSVLTLAVASVVIVLAAALALMLQATVAHARAQSVADLSALAAARAAQRTAFGDLPDPAPCARAADVAAHNGGRVTACSELAAGRVRVDVAVRTPLGDARATARAGPRSP